MVMFLQSLDINANVMFSKASTNGMNSNGSYEFSKFCDGQVNIKK